MNNENLDTAAIGGALLIAGLMPGVAIVVGSSLVLGTGVSIGVEALRKNKTYLNARSRVCDLTSRKVKLRSVKS